MKCGEATASVQMIEEFQQEEDGPGFWTLPEQVQRVRAERKSSREAVSQLHRQHPAIGYKRIPKERRPTWEGSAAESAAAEAASAAAAADQDSEEEDNAAESSSSAEERIPQNNRARRNVAAREQQAGKRKRTPEETEVVTKETTHPVCAVFGQLDEDSPREVWLGVKLSSRSNKVRLQYLGPVDDQPGMYTLHFEDASFKKEDIVHTFKAVKFTVTTTYKLTKAGKRKKGAPESQTVTKEPFDAAEISKLEAHLARDEANGLFD